jgi:hypothetical protein
LGREPPPQFFHHVLVMKTPAQKLSKADRDTSVRELRAGGATAGDIIGRAARLAGLTKADGPFGPIEAVRLVSERHAAVIQKLSDLSSSRAR